MFERLSAGTLLIVALTASSGCASKQASELPAELDKKAAAAIAGEWGLQLELSGYTVDGLLDLSFDGSIVAGTFKDADGNLSELSNIRISGGKISWEMERKPGTLLVQGDVNLPIMSGKLKLRREKDEDADSGTPGSPHGGGYGGGGRPGGGMGGRHGGHGGGGRHSSGSDSFEWIAHKRAATETTLQTPK